MARINIEDSLFSDPRFLDLVALMGDAQKALGAVCFAWITAQKFWKNNGSPIPSVEFRSRKLPIELITVGLAEETEDGAVYMKGAEKQFAWLTQRQNAGRENKGKSGKRNQTESNGRERTQTSYSSSPSSSFSSSHSNSKNKELRSSEGLKKRDPSEPTQSQLVWDAYCTAFKTKYKTDPVRNATVNSQIKALVGRLGAEAVEIVKFYVNHNQRFYTQNFHSMGICLKDAESLRTQWATGRTNSLPRALNQELIEEVLAEEAEKNARFSNGN